MFVSSVAERFGSYVIKFSVAFKNIKLNKLIRISRCFLLLLVCLWTKIQTLKLNQISENLIVLFHEMRRLQCC